MKNTIRKTVFVLALASLYTNAYAVATYTTTTELSVGAQKVKPSNKVTIKAASDATGYGACASHSAGDRQYGTSEDNTKIYWHEGVTLTDPSATTQYTGAGWSAL
jgi:hypothetical protein